MDKEYIDLMVKFFDAQVSFEEKPGFTYITSKDIKRPSYAEKMKMHAQSLIKSKNYYIKGIGNEWEEMKKHLTPEEIEFYEVLMNTYELEKRHIEKKPNFKKLQINIAEINLKED